jgi:hypothetical protein
MPAAEAGDIRKVPVQVRLPENLVKRLDHLCVDWDLYRNELIEQLLLEGLKTWNGPEASRS